MRSRRGSQFIDEAHDLDPIGDRFKGGPIANELLTLAENQRERLSIILAGYDDDLNKKLFAYNQGLKSRFVSCDFRSRHCDLWLSQTLPPRAFAP